jgi:predicted aldo/keto reductase-like oxidoreductase
MTMKKDGITRREIIRNGAVIGTGLVVGAAGGGRIALAGPKVPQVPRKVLGKTKQKIPILLFGASMDLDPVFDPKMAEALRYGVNYIDAAAIYGGGKCEGAVGNFQAKAGIRNKLWITSKSKHHDPQGFQRTFNNSLKDLKTNYIDLYFLHALRDKKYLSKDLLEVVRKMKKSGQLKFFGFSCHHDNVNEMLHAAAETPWVDAVMFRYNFRNYGKKELNKAIDAAAKANVGLIAMKTQGSATSFKDEVLKFRKTGKFNKHQAVLKAVWKDDRIAAAVSHMDTLGKLHENIAAALNRSKLSRAEENELERYAHATRRFACDGCEHICGGAVDAPVRIGETMRYLMYHDVYDERAKAKKLFAELPPEARALDGIDFDRASKACPNRVNVGWHMERAKKVLI